MINNYLSNLKHCVLLFCAALLFLPRNTLAAGAFEAVELRCEYGANPTAISEPHPRLGWVVQSSGKQRGVRQSAYRVLVASSLELLNDNQGDLWDSSRVASDESAHVSYAGQPLASGQVCYWKAMLWDGNGKPSRWSESACWTMGLLNPSDWKAKWIGFEPAAGEEAALSGTTKKLLRLDENSWVWANGAQAGEQPPGKMYFRKLIQVPEGRTLRQATFLIAADDSFSLWVNGHSSGQGSGWQKAVAVDITGRLRAGANALGLEVTNAGEKPTPAGLIGRLVIAFADGEPLVIEIDGSWQSSHEATPRWNWPDGDTSNWQPATEIAKYGDQPWGKTDVSLALMEPAPFFRKNFTIGKPVKHATLYASALGVYELHLNGNAVDTDVLSPGWTDYRKRVHYFAYDVTRQLKRGQNALGAILGDGWYAGYLAFSGKRHYYGDHTRFIAQLDVEYEDGTNQTLGTDETWKAAVGPIREGDLLMGCLYDARKEIPGWDQAVCEETQWQNATVDEGVKVTLEAHPGAPIRRMLEVHARKVTQPKPGVYVFDLGQNMVGWVRLKAKGTAGQKVVVRHAEMLNPDGTIYTANLRAAKATDTYYLAGGAKRAYEPHFTFHGFQYVEITGLNYQPDLTDVTGIVVYSDLPRAGWFECSEPLVNRLTLNSLWGQRGNFLDVPTDCPQRDERAGWTGDAQVFMKTACFNLDAPRFYTKWLVDLCQDSQRDDGAFGDVAPHISIVGYGNTGWSDSGPVCNWRMYEMYGDRRTLEAHYASLVRHLEYLSKTSKDLVRGTLAYGDWLRLAGPQHSDAIGTAYYYYTASIMVRIANALGKNEDAEKYLKLGEDIRAVFVKNFIKDDGQIIDSKNETGQTLYALAFGLDLVPAEMKSKVVEQFVGSIRKQDDHLATGFLGTPFVLFALQKAGHPELSYRLVLNRTYPSWLQQVLWGSTTMWERWDGWRPDKGFQDPGMNSFNHYWLGCVSEWLFTEAAGIDTDGPGFKQIFIRPEIVPPDQGFKWVKASYNSVRGPISSAWRVDRGHFELNIAIPANCTARVRVPAQDTGTVTESGRRADRSRGVKLVGQEGSAAVFELGSGHYIFRSKL